jgi:hypothetical protein
MKRIVLKGKVLFTNREGAIPSTTVYEPYREYVVEDVVAAHPVFADRIDRIEDVKTEPKEPEANPVQKRTTRRRKNVANSSSVS